MKKVLASAAGLLGILFVALVLAIGVGAMNANSADSVSEEIIEFAPWCDGRGNDTVYGCPLVVPR